MGALIYIWYYTPDKAEDFSWDKVHIFVTLQISFFWIITISEIYWNFWMN